MERDIRHLGSIGRSGLVLIAAITAFAYLVSQKFSFISPLTISLVIALLLSNLMQLPESTNVAASFASKTLMRAGIVLIGLRISYQQISEVGISGSILVILVVVSTFFGAVALGKLFKISTNTSILIGVGFSICGNTAITAISPAINAKREETAYAVGLVTLFGTISIAALPAAGALLGLSEARFGAWAGAAVHDVGQVIATTEVIGGAALSIAVLIKLTRMLLLAPMLVAITAKFNSSATEKFRATIPMFIVLFIAVTTMNSFFDLPENLLEVGKTASTLLLTAGIAGMGLGVKWRNLAQVGKKPLLIGGITWIIVAAGSLGLIAVLNVA